MNLAFVGNLHATGKFIMPQWAEPRRHTVVGSCVCVCICMSATCFSETATSYALPIAMQAQHDNISNLIVSDF